MLAARRSRCATRAWCRRVPPSAHVWASRPRKNCGGSHCVLGRHAFVDKATLLVLSQVVDSPAGWECCRRPRRGRDTIVKIARRPDPASRLTPTGSHPDIIDICGDRYGCAPARQDRRRTGPGTERVPSRKDAHHHGTHRPVAHPGRGRPHVRRRPQNGDQMGHRRAHRINPDTRWPPQIPRSGRDRLAARQDRIAIAK